MKESVKFSVDLQNPTTINPLITRYKVFICTPDEPANNFIFSKDVLIKMSNTILGCAVVAGFMNGEDASVLGGHENNIAPDGYGNMIRTPKPVGIGFADPYIEPWFEEYKGKEFLTTFVYLWTGRFPELNDFSERNIFQSMEAAIDSEKQGIYKIVTDAMVVGLCVLQDVEPAFKDSTFIQFSSEECISEVDALKKEYSKLFANTPKKYKDLDFKIPQSVKENAKKGLNLRKEYGRGGTSVGLTTANYLIDNEIASAQKVRHIAKYFPRHSKDNLDEKNPPSNGYIAWLLWGSDEGWKWSQKLVDDMEEIDKQKKTSKQSFKESEDNNLDAFKNDEIGSGDYSIKLNKSKDAMSEKSWGDIDKTSLMNKILKAKNVKIIVDDIYAQVEAGWEEAPSQHLKYPIMEVRADNEAVYNRYALKSALGYAKTQNENAIVNKINEIYKKMGLDKDNFSEFDLSEEDYNFIFADENKDKEGTERMSKLSKEKKQEMLSKISPMCDTKKYTKEDQEVNKYSKPIDIDEQHCYAYDNEFGQVVAIPYSVEDEDVKMSYDEAKKVKMSHTWADKVEGEEDEDEDDIYMSMIEAKTGKKFSSDENTEALAASIRNEMQAEYDKQLAEKMSEMEVKMSQMTEEMASIKAENDTLKAEDAKRKNQEKMARVEYALQSVIDTIPQDKIEEMRKDSETFSLDDIHIWENKVKAEAYDFSKGNTKTSNFTKLGLPFVENTPKETKSIWDKV